MELSIPHIYIHKYLKDSWLSYSLNSKKSIFVNSIFYFWVEVNGMEHLSLSMYLQLLD